MHAHTHASTHTDTHPLAAKRLKRKTKFSRKETWINNIPPHPRNLSAPAPFSWGCQWSCACWPARQPVLLAAHWTGCPLASPSAKPPPAPPEKGGVEISHHLGQLLAFTVVAFKKTLFRLSSCFYWSFRMSSLRSSCFYWGFGCSSLTSFSCFYWLLSHHLGHLHAFTGALESHRWGHLAFTGALESHRWGHLAFPVHLPPQTGSHGITWLYRFIHLLFSPGGDQCLLMVHFAPFTFIFMCKHSGSSSLCVNTQVVHLYV